MIKWFERNKNNIIRNSFLLPILLVVIMSISHVVSWYDLGNPLSWAIYLSIAVEIFALASVSATTIKMNRNSVYFLFIIVTIIQIMGNVFFEYCEIDPEGKGFLSWIELIAPVFNDWDSVDHRRFLALIQGATLPMMSLVALHFYIKFNDQIEDINKKDKPKKNKEEKEDDIIEDFKYSDAEMEEKIQEEEKSDLAGLQRGSEDNYYRPSITEESNAISLDDTNEKLDEIKEMIEKDDDVDELERIVKRENDEILNKKDEQEYTNEELNLAKAYWKKKKGTFKNVHVNDILDFYRKRGKEIDPNTGKFKKLIKNDPNCR